jgi:hypothetical protein
VELTKRPRKTITDKAFKHIDALFDEKVETPPDARVFRERGFVGEVVVAVEL